MACHVTKRLLSKQYELGHQYFARQVIQLSNNQAKSPMSAATKTMPAAIITAPFILTTMHPLVEGALKVAL
jgi:hypothetical protein